MLSLFAALHCDIHFLFLPPSIERKHIQAAFSIKNVKGLAVFLISSKNPPRLENRAGKESF